MPDTVYDRAAFDNLDIGDYVADMHYGEQPLRDRFEVVSHVQWDEPDHGRDLANQPHPFWRYLEQFRTGGFYTNKMLVVIDIGLGTRVCGYAYDGRRNGIIVLRKKEG